MENCRRVTRYSWFQATKKASGHDRDHTIPRMHYWTVVFLVRNTHWIQEIVTVTPGDV